MDNNIFEIDNIHRTREGKPVSIRLIDKERRNMEINMKWDGCIDLFKYDNGYTVDDKATDEDDVDYIHICEVKEFIARLEEVVRIAEENFEKEDFENGWS